METEVKAKKIGGSIVVIIPNDIVVKQRILPNDTVSIRVKKLTNLDFLWGKLEDVKKSTQKIMEEIDEGE